MQKKIYAIMAILVLFSFSACLKYTDIKPKGKNILDRVSDIDNLLNYNFAATIGAFNFESPSVLVDDQYPRLLNVPNNIAAPTKDFNYVLLTYDETIDRANLVTSDTKYEGLYSIISTIANIVLAQADVASGDRALANQLKAEAYILRAYCHYLLVNVYAKAYDPATAATDGGIPYVNTIDFVKLNAKNSVAEVYKNMLSDIDEALALNSLPDQPKNTMRVGKGFAYAVKARVLLSMRNYAGALDAVNSGLSYNNVIEDQRPFLSVANGGTGTTFSRSLLSSPDNLFVASNSTTGAFANGPSLEIDKNYYEAGNIVRNYLNVWMSLVANTGVTGSVVLWAAGAAYQSNLAGLTTSDLYLIKAECLARSNKVTDAMDIINSIRIRRDRPADYVPLTATTEAQAMAYLMKTSRIEYLFTYKNFFDIKRWNAEGTYAQTITRTINNITYTLKPDSKLWIFPFPQSATNYNINLTQNY